MYPMSPKIRLLQKFQTNLTFLRNLRNLLLRFLFL
jgi:hypothetical protein